MKKLIIALMCLSAGVAGVQGHVFAQAASATAMDPNAPKFSFKDGDTFDFGTVKEGPNAEHKFNFSNVGRSPLIITNASASCSCTVPAWPKEPILPGKAGDVTVSFTTKGHVGPFIKDVYIQSNAMKGNERYTVHIKGVVVADAAATTK
jgi:hypothetical protein